MNLRGTCKSGQVLLSHVHIAFSRDSPASFLECSLAAILDRQDWNVVVDVFMLVVSGFDTYVPMCVLRQFKMPESRTSNAVAWRTSLITRRLRRRFTMKRPFAFRKTIHKVQFTTARGLPLELINI